MPTVTLNGSQYAVPEGTNQLSYTTVAMPPWTATTASTDPIQYYNWTINIQVSAANTTAATYYADPIRWPDFRDHPSLIDHAAIEQRRQKDAILRRKAHQRGRKLLLSLLTDEQVREYARTQAFTVVGSKGGIFRLKKEGRVQELDLHGKPIALHCIHTSFAYIREDNLIALKMLVEGDEMEFRKVANVTRVAPREIAIAA